MVLCPAVEYSPFYGIEKGAVLQEARVFNDSHVDPRRCQQVRRAAADASQQWQLRRQQRQDRRCWNDLDVACCCCHQCKPVAEDLS